MRKHPQITAIIDLLRKHSVISWTELKVKTMPKIYARPNELTRTILKLSEEGMVSLETEEIDWYHTRIVRIKYIGNNEPIRKPIKIVPKERCAKKVEVELVDQMPCKARITKCYHEGCYLADICSIRPEYIFKEEQ